VAVPGVADVQQSADRSNQRSVQESVPFFTPPGGSGDFKTNIYDLPYIYSKGNGVKNATACSAF
jgi:hypothetical protein